MDPEPAPTIEWTLRPDGPPDGLGADVAGVGDVNGDGFADVLIGRPAASRPHEYQGRVELYLGSAAGLATAPAWSRDGARAGEHLGIEVAGAGDVDGDGFADVLVASVRCGEPQVRGCVALWRGAPSGLGADVGWTWQEDLGSGWIGRGLAAAGDVDGDGFGDVLVAGPGNLGAVRLFRGGPSGLAATPAWRVLGVEGERLATSVDHAGDVNGDGFADVIVGSASGPRVWYGAARGPAQTPDWTYTGDGAGGRVGPVVAGAGDLDGDGFDDVVVADPRSATPSARSTPLVRPWDDRPPANGVGRVVVFRGGPTGLATEPVWTVEGSFGGLHLGHALAGVGDVTGDSVDDLAVTGPGFGSRERPVGAVAVFAGGPGGPGRAPTLWVTGSGETRHLGAALSAAGDVDGDGRAEVLVGADPDDDGSVERSVVVVGATGTELPPPHLPVGLFSPPPGPSGPLPWANNEVLRDWPYACPAQGFHPVVDSIPIPRERRIAGVDNLMPRPPTCEEGAGAPVAWGEERAGLSPEAALAAWSAGAVQVEWCDGGLPVGELTAGVRPDPTTSPDWQLPGEPSWLDGCPWRQVMRVPVLLELGYGDALTGTVPAWLVVTGPRPASWTLQSRGLGEVALDGALRSAATAAVGGPFAANLKLWTNGKFGHRQLRLVALPPDGTRAERRDLDGQWRWTPP